MQTQDTQLDVTMLISNMLAEADAKKPPVGQGGRDYEEHINGILKKHGKADKDATTAGSSADAPDAQFNHGGKKHNLEIKADSKAMFGQMELKHDGEQWDFSEKSKKKYPETHKQLVKSGFLKKINSQWKKPTGKYEEDLKMGNVYHDVDSAEPIKAHYGKDRKTDYIQIGGGHGFYHTGNDAAKLGSPELEGKTQLRARMKARGRDKAGNRTYGALVVMSLKNAAKSHHDLESQVHKEWIDYILNGPQLVEATNVVTKPIEPGDSQNHHIIHITVSKDGKRQVRKATVTTHHGEGHAIKKAYKHYEDNGYEVHGHKVMKELEKEESKMKKESVEEGYNNNRTGFAKRRREDDEYHTPDPVTRTHKIAFDVSKDGGEKHNRTVTISNSTKSHEEAKATAKAHLEKQGYKIHEASDICAVCGQTPCNCTTLDEAGNKPLEPHVGMGDSRTPRELKTQMTGATDDFVKSAAKKKLGMFHSKVAHMQNKLAKSELRKRTNEEVEQIDEAHKIGDKVIITKGPKDVIGKTGHVGEIRHGGFKGAVKTYTIDHEGGSVQLKSTHFKKHISEEVEQIDEAPKDHTIEAHGIKGTKGTPWRKTFKHEDHLNDWADKNDSVEVHGIRELEGAKKQVKEEVAANNVGGGSIAGTQDDAGKKSVMTKPPMKRQELKKFSFFVSQEHDK